MAQVVGRRYSAVIGFEIADDAKKTATIIKRSAANLKAPGNGESPAVVGKPWHGFRFAGRDGRRTVALASKSWQGPGLSLGGPQGLSHLANRSTG